MLAWQPRIFLKSAVTRAASTMVNQKRWLRTAAASLASYVFFSAALHRLHLLDAPPPSLEHRAG